MVSVVIPTFNRGEHLIGAVKSVLAQTYRDYEIIVVDDGSNDDTLLELKPYMGRIRYFYQQNQGAGSARNRGIEAAAGEWISMLDSDDVWLPTKLERQFEAIATLGRDFGACFTDCEFAGDTGLHQTVFELGGLDKGRSFGVLANPLYYVVFRRPVIRIPSLLVRRSLMDELGGFDETMTVAEDTDLLFRLALKTRFCFVAEPLVKIDRTPTRSTGLMELFYRGDEKAFCSKEHMYKKWLESAEAIDPAAGRRILELLRELYVEWAIRKIKQLRFREAFEKTRLAKEIGLSSLEIFSKMTSRAARKITRPFPRLDRIP